MKSQLDLSKVDDKAIEEGIELKSERKYCQICCCGTGYIFFCLLVMNAIYNLHLEVSHGVLNLWLSWGWA